MFCIIRNNAQSYLIQLFLAAAYHPIEGVTADVILQIVLGDRDIRAVAHQLHLNEHSSHSNSVDVLLFESHKVVIFNWSKTSAVVMVVMKILLAEFLGTPGKLQRQRDRSLCLGDPHKSTQQYGNLNTYVSLSTWKSTKKSCSVLPVTEKLKWQITSPGHHLLRSASPP